MTSSATPVRNGSDFLNGDGRVFEHVVEKRGNDHVFRAFGPYQQSGHCQRVDDIRDLRAFANLFMVGPCGQFDGIVEASAVSFGGLRHVV